MQYGLGLQVVTPCETVAKYQRFGGTYCFHLHGLVDSVLYSEMLVCTYKSARRRNTEDHHRHLHVRANLKSHVLDQSLVTVGFCEEPGSCLQDVYYKV